MRYLKTQKKTTLTPLGQNCPILSTPV